MNNAQNMGYPMRYSHVGSFLGFGIGGLILSVLLWVLIIWLIVAVVRRLTCGSRWSRGDWKQRMQERHQQHMQWRDNMKGNSALNILKERYAKGEINKEEFDQKKNDLST